MKKTVTLVLAILAFGIFESNAQDYKIAAGLGLSFGSDFTFFGPSGKFFLAEEHALQGELFFEEGVTMINALYNYNGAIGDVEGLNWFAGGGLSFLFGDGGGNEFALRPIGGLEYVINGAPLALTFDWRPILGLGDLGNEVGTFGIGIRYVIQ